MRLVLTSNGFPKANQNSRKELLSLVGKPVAEIRVAFIPIASEVEIDPSFSKIDRYELVEMGILQEHITDLDLHKPVSFEDLKPFDVVFVDGGNSFYLLQHVRASGFCKAIREYLENDCGVYVGVSAGTVLAGPNVEVSEPWDDKSKAILSDTFGLGFVPEAFIPHAVEKEKDIIESLRAKADYPVVELPDGRAVMIWGDRKTIIMG